MKNKTILIIAGPTASGKTELGIKCANMFNGEIISADSMQIYKNLNIGTAKPNNTELTLAKHHMIDIVNCDAYFSVQEYVEKAEEIINNLFKANKLPIIVGGTGLYIKSLIYPYSFCNIAKDDNIRNKYNELLVNNGKDYIYDLLKKKDPVACEKIHVNDIKRVIRALEICELSGAKKTELNEKDVVSQEKLKYNCIFIVLDIPRDVLYNRINLRVDKMFDQGLINEVENLLKNNMVNENCQSMQAIGYKEFFKYLKTELNLEELKELIKKNSRNYAKRQLTFFKGFKNAVWFNPQTQEKEIFEYIKKNLL